MFQEALIHAADTGKDYEHCIELQKKANDHESAVSISIQLNLCKTVTLKKPEIGFQCQFRLMQVKSIAECSKGSILHYFRPSISYHLSLRSLFCLFLSGDFTQVLLYMNLPGCTLECNLY